MIWIASCVEVWIRFVHDGGVLHSVLDVKQA